MEPDVPSFDGRKLRLNVYVQISKPNVFSIIVSSIKLTRPKFDSKPSSPKVLRYLCALLSYKTALKPAQSIRGKSNISLIVVRPRK